MARVKFGTDGWRAVISEDFTFENVKIVAQAIADFVKSQRPELKKKGSELYGKKFALVVGYDTRFLSEKYAELVSLVLAANGIKVLLGDRPAPTPSVSFNIRHKNFMGGVMITASHNPARYNGIKYKGHFGGSVEEDVTDAIEKRLYKSRVKIIDNDSDDKFAPRKQHKDQKLSRKQKHTKTEGNITDLGALSDIGAAQLQR